MKTYLVLVALMLLGGLAAAAEDDPYLWLEEIDSKQSLAWVERHNARTLERLTGDERYAAIYEDTLDDLARSDRLPAIRVIGNDVYDLLQDAEHPRGLWRRMALGSFLAGKTSWETVLDVDALDAREKRSWVFRDAACHPPEHRRCMLLLSPGGSDAAEWREFDLVKKAFVPDGFALPEAKTSVSWSDADTLLVSMASGGDTQTLAGYGREVRAWQRGEAYDEAPVVFEIDAGHMMAQPRLIKDAGSQFNLLVDAVTIFQYEYYRLGDDGQPVRLHLPAPFQLSTVHKGWVIGLLQQDWQGAQAIYPQGALVGFRMTDLTQPPEEAAVLFAPESSQAVQSLLGTGILATDDAVYFSILDNVAGRMLRLTYDDGVWQEKAIALPDNGTTSPVAAAAESDSVIVRFESFTQPPSLYASVAGGAARVIDSLEAKFDAGGLVTEQHFATSGDGTRVPYFIVRPKALVADGTAPLLLGAYGGFNLAMTPGYMGSIFGAGAPFKTIVEAGGSYVLANIRGGGEYGPGWHLAGMLENRQRVYDDFHAVAQDLIDRKLASAEKLAIVGASNSGLLMGVAMTQHPERYRAVLCGVPILDMRRYHRLLAGASWMGEYGDPDDPLMWDVMKAYSPYHNLSVEESYPEVFFFGSTRDDRVHPGHARKMGAKMGAMGHPFLFYENTEGGHGAAADPIQQARLQALQAVYLLQELDI